MINNLCTFTASFEIFVKSQEQIHGNETVSQIKISHNIMNLPISILC